MAFDLKEIDWGKVAGAAIAGGIEFINALGVKVDLDKLAATAMAAVIANRARKAAAEKVENDVFTSVDDGEK